jgi:cytochrome c oxidase cbb3-type subunit 1
MRFMIVALSFYGMSTFEGPLMSLKDVNALSHYTDWTVGHVHSGALGWVAMIAFGSLYHMIPRLWKTEMYSVKLISAHFWLATIGVLLYITAMWISGISQGLMWRAFDDFGNLQYSFVESVAAMHPFYAMRAIGGMFFLTGMLLMAYNVTMTIRQGVRAAEAGGARVVTAAV